jgi:NAD-reducing hydrogenase small subunit
MSDKVRFATVWLGGCSGCHMSFLDLDEWLLELAERVELVFGPLTDAKEFPEAVDLTLVEGAVTNEDNLEVARTLRERSRVVVSFGDCAVTGNVTALRNGRGDPEPMLRRVYVEHPDLSGQLPHGVVPALLPQARPLHEVIAVDVYLPGCPPSAKEIRSALTRLLDVVASGAPLPTSDELGPDEPKFG